MKEKKLVCPKCKGENVEIEEKGNNVGVFCNDCGEFSKCYDKEDLRAFTSFDESAEESEE